METFGRKLGQAMRAKGLRLADVAQATGLDIEHVLALGRDDFGALPDDHIVEQGLRSFARLVDVKPDQVIADFRQQRERSALQPRPETTRTAARRAVGLAIPLLITVACGAVAFLYWPRASTAPSSGMATAVAQNPPPSPATTARAVPRPASPRPTGPPPRPAEPPPRPAESFEKSPATRMPINAPMLSIPDHGVGRGIANHELVGETRRFSEGERVWFWTRIERGTPDDTIEHVWMHEGVEVHRVPVRVGAARWRAHSYKSLNAGSAGDWAVEARDSAGRVLARSEFSCSRRDGAVD